MFNDDFDYKYCPVLAIRPSEMTALRELPGKDKDLILPIFPIKRWLNSLELSNSIKKIEESIGEERKWIADIDYTAIEGLSVGEYRPVHHEIKALMDSSDGYKNWCSFIKEHPNAVPCLQLKDLSQFSTQLQVLCTFQRGVVLLLKQADLESKVHEEILPQLTEVEDLLVILDLEQITKEFIDLQDQILLYLQAIRAILPNALMSLSSTSFPDGFGGYHKGTKTIYERSLFDKIRINIEGLIYSDRGSARASKLSGGIGTPPPRIDYACKNEWHFIRMELSDSITSMEKGISKTMATKSEKKELYTTIAKKIMAEPYWEKDLALYSNYIIELTGEGDEFGIDSAQKATAARINKHLHTQLHYDSVDDLPDTDEDWID